METNTPRIRFEGCEFAHDMGRIFAENLADLLAKVSDGTDGYEPGFLHTSTLPHPGVNYYDQIWARDAGRGVQELARLGYFPEALSCVEYFLRHKNFGDHWGRVISQPMVQDYELDGNSHILNGISQTFTASGNDTALGRKFLSQCMDVFAWMGRLMDDCPFGDLIPCQSELAGNPCGGDPVYAIYPDYGALVAMKNFLRMAECCGDDRAAETLRRLAERLENSITALLVSDGAACSPNIPAGVWLNGLTAERQSFETADFGAPFSISRWTRQLPFIQEFDRSIAFLPVDPAAEIHRASYRFLKHGMAENYLFRKYGFVSCTCFAGAGGRHDDTMCGYGQNYFTQAALMNDDVNTYGKCLEGIARLAYDGDVIEPLAFEMNPFVLHECFDYGNYEQALDHTFGTRPDPARGIADNDGDEGNLVQACETLKTLALTVGLSAQNGVLTVAPRLPWKWDEMELTDYPVYDEKGTCHRVSLVYRHERSQRSCSCTVHDCGTLQSVRVRFGPFAPVLSTRSDLSAFQVQSNEIATFLWYTGGLRQSIRL